MAEELQATCPAVQIDNGLLRLFPDAGALQHDEVKSSHDSNLPSFLAWKEGLRPIKPDAELHPTVLERFAKAKVAQYDTMKPYRPMGLANHYQVEHFYRSESSAGVA